MSNSRFESNFINAITGEGTNVALKKSLAVNIGVGLAGLVILLNVVCLGYSIITPIGVGFLSFLQWLMVLSPLAGVILFGNGFIAKFSYENARLMERGGLIILGLSFLSFFSPLWINLIAV